ncbi:hypothetical protein SLEP1_g52903 [Rubroshorea leprosula]|uniref:Uncharacterized protein n=1 Tax=Rubroshorea leprosula TaxID=152421 RepID=A0AAV5M7R5_9ROSI|nr:hypothetical protein SLEP1_g52903 [Rubroshorea leprosula]
MLMMDEGDNHNSVRFDDECDAFDGGGGGDDLIDIEFIYDLMGENSDPQQVLFCGWERRFWCNLDRLCSFRGIPS